MPLVCYVSELEKNVSLDAERLLRLLGVSGKLSGPHFAVYMLEQVQEKQSGTLWAMTTGPLKDTPALDALKASCGALIITYITQITAYFMEGGVAYDRS